MWLKVGDFVRHQITLGTATPLSGEKNYILPTLASHILVKVTDIGV